MHNYLIKVYITTVCLCYLHCYMFRHFRVTIRQFTTNASISYKHFSNFQLLKIQFINLTFMGLCIVRIFQYISNKMQRYTVYFIWKLLYMFRVVTPPIIRSANNCIYSIWYLLHRYCYPALSRKSLSVLWVAYATHSTLKRVPTLPRERQIAVTV